MDLKILSDNLHNEATKKMEFILNLVQVSLGIILPCRRSCLRCAIFTIILYTKHKRKKTKMVVQVTRKLIFIALNWQHSFAENETV